MCLYQFVGACVCCGDREKLYLFFEWLFGLVWIGERFDE